MNEVCIRMAKELAPELDKLIQNRFDGSKLRMIADEELRKFLWENKVGILRILQEVAKN